MGQPFLFYRVKKARQIAFIIRLKNVYHSGWIPFGITDTTGLSRNSYKKLFAECIELGLLRKGNRGYFIVSFKKCLVSVYGENGKYLRITNKEDSFKSITHEVLKSLVYAKIKQQYTVTTETILDKMGASRNKRLRRLKLNLYLKNEEGVYKCRLSSRSIASSVGISNVLANQIINEFRKSKVLKIRKPLYPVINNYINVCINNNRWLCEREVLKIKEVLFKPFPNPSIM